ncbi:IS66 family insertion sequence element accessory protein TnpB [Stieleria varia]|uniref:IS66 Orf2 like protein n=1 Tax=Stieleria varia TaxID=2528005 RepID=A0A5C6B723_9BACT|nr:IS66 family insertion sequence element accessory protein TnpB [Stieleria varia]TWU07833.1 IS66 Orf2 like protein [Stieleria varia]
MIGLPQGTKVLFFTAPTDMRKSHCGLSGLIRNELGGDPADGTLFLFLNRRRDRLKALYWDRDGLALWYKRLEQGTYERFRTTEDSKAIEIDATDLAMLLSGVSIQSAKRRKRFSRAA